MSTRGLLAFRLAGEVKAGYNHADSYPSGLGVDALQFLRKQDDLDLALLRESVARLQVVSNAVRPTPEQITALGEYAETQYDDGRLDNWYVLLHATQGDPEKILAAGYVENSFNFGYDGLFCEWAYVIDLDDRCFDVYASYGHDPGGPGLWDPATRPAGAHADRDGVKRVVRFPFMALPDDETFLKIVNDPDGD